MTCRNICTKYKTTTPTPTGTARYGGDRRRCQVCCIWLTWEGLHCPCCGMRLRMMMRRGKSGARAYNVDVTRGVKRY